jgi:hypothetical protein
MLPEDATLANSAILLQLLQRLIDTKLMPRGQVLAILVDAADELVRDASQTSYFHILAAEIIRKELMPKV